MEADAGTQSERVGEHPTPPNATDQGLVPLLDVSGVVVEFRSMGGVIRALDGVSFRVSRGETVAVVGESGCGKTTLARAILGLQPVSSGSIQLMGREVRGTQRGLAELAGIVWQDPYASLDPRWPVGRSVEEPARLVGRRVNVDALMAEVGLDPGFADRFPHQLSGGQRQRVAIARAIALRPPLVLCDEPTAALDLSIRAQILNLLIAIQRHHHCAILYISHDLLTVRFLAQRVAVMYLGRIVEEGATEEVFESPRHPYTKALLDSAPTLDRLHRLPEAEIGELPDPHQRFAGCRFAPRCPRAQARCVTDDPVPQEADGRKTACHYPLHSDSL